MACFFAQFRAFSSWKIFAESFLAKSFLFCVFLCLFVAEKWLKTGRKTAFVMDVGHEKHEKPRKMDFPGLIYTYF
jgi:hypothetical protein